MTRALRLACATLAVSACVSCQPPDDPSATRDKPLIGRLQLHDRRIDLDVDAFAGDGPNAVPPGAFARVIADIDKTGRRARDDADRPDPTRARP